MRAWPLVSAPVTSAPYVFPRWREIEAWSNEHWPTERMRGLSMGAISREGAKSDDPTALAPSFEL